MTAKHKILIVEDSFILGKRLNDLLTDHGYTVIGIADNYQDSVKFLNSEIPDLALLDIQINGDKDGIDLAEYIYKHFKTAVIFISSHNDPKTTARARQAHPNTFILKPEELRDKDVLIEKIKEQVLLSVQMAIPDETQRNNNRKGVYLKLKEVALAQKIKYIKETDSYWQDRFIEFDDICYIEANNDYQHNTVLIHTKNKHTAFIVRATMNEMKVLLPEQFHWIHKSYIVNLHRITGYQSNEIIIDDTPLAIGAKYKEELDEQLNRLKR